jgi:competence protein ComEC
MRPIFPPLPRTPARYEPTLPAIVAFAAGDFALQQAAELPARPTILALAGAALTVAVLAWRCVRQRHFARWLLVAGAGVLSFALAAWRAADRLDDALPAALEGRDIAVVGVVASLPQRFDRGERFEFAVESTPVRVPERLLLTWYHAWDEEEPPADDDPASATVVRDRSLPPLHPGERWRFTVRLKRPHGGANPGGFDYEAMLFERGVRATGYVRSRAPPVRIDAFVPGFSNLVERTRDLLRDRFVAVLADAPYAGILEALAIGDQRAIPERQWRIFNRTGVTHLMSISGLHVTMLAALCAAIANWLWRRSTALLLALPAQRAAVLAGWLAAFAYALLAGFAVPAQRTLYMLSVVALALFSGRHFGAARTLLLALLVVVVLDPWAVLSAGFWLSFGAVGILLYAGTPRIGRAGAGGGREWSDWRGVSARLAQWGLTQWAVTLGTLPLLLLLFQQFSLVSPLANALAIPFVSFVVTPLALLFAIVPWPPLIVFDHALLAGLMHVLEVLADWPVWQQPAPSPAATLLALAGVVCLLLPRGFPARWVASLLLLPALLPTVPRPAAGDAWVDVLDVGHGLAVVVRTAANTLVYDTGPRYGADADAGRRVLLPFLRSAGVDRIDTLVVSHRDSDHAGGTLSLLDSLPVGRIVSSSGELVGGSGGERCRAGQRWQWDGVSFAILHPLASAYAGAPASNHLSCVLRIESSRGRVALLVADIEAADEAALLARSAAAIASDLLVAPHHGSRSSSTPAFVAAVGASDVVFSVAYRDRFGHPAPETVARYAAARQWRSDRDGELAFVLGETLTTAVYRAQHRRYWND